MSVMPQITVIGPFQKLNLPPVTIQSNCDRPITVTIEREPINGEVLVKRIILEPKKP